MSKEELLDSVWGGRFVTEAALTSRIKAARRALGDDGESQRFIRTVRGRGYQFVATLIADAPARGRAPSLCRDEPPPPRQHIAFCRAADGVRLAYAVAGEGPPLVRAANWMTHLGYDIESPVWKHWVRDLSENAPVHSLRRAWMWFIRLGCNRFHLRRLGGRPGVGGRGAWAGTLSAAWRVAGRRRRGGLCGPSSRAGQPPGAVQRVCARAGCPGVGDDEKRAAALDLELARVGWGRDDPAFRQVFAAQFLPDGTRADWAAFDQLQRRTTSPENAVRFLEEFGRIDVRDLARDVVCPTLIMHSRDDHRVPLRFGEELASLIPDSRLVALSSNNHLLTAIRAGMAGVSGRDRRFSGV